MSQSTWIHPYWIIVINESFRICFWGSYMQTYNITLVFKGSFLKNTMVYHQFPQNKVPCYCFLSEGCVKFPRATITFLSWLIANALDTLSEYPPVLQVPACCCCPEALVSRVTCEVPFLHLYASFPLSSSLVIKAGACLLR